jgi:hypothetical protein
LENHPRDVKKATVIAIVDGRDFTEVGYNRRKFPVNGTFTFHAEEAALKKSGRRARGAYMLVVRVKKNGSYGLAKPCVKCESLAKKAGIVKIEYSTENGWSKT